MAAGNQQAGSTSSCRSLLWGTDGCTCPPPHLPQPFAASSVPWWPQCKHCGLSQWWSGCCSLGEWQIFGVCTAMGRQPGWRLLPASPVPKSWGTKMWHVLNMVRKQLSKRTKLEQNFFFVKLASVREKQHLSQAKQQTAPESRAKITSWNGSPQCVRQVCAAARGLWGLLLSQGAFWLMLKQTYPNKGQGTKSTWEKESAHLGNTSSESKCDIDFDI